MDVLSWSDDRGPEQVWLPPFPGQDEPSTGWADGGPFAVPAAIVASRGSGVAWPAWITELSGNMLTGQDNGRFSIAQVPDEVSPWQALGIIRAQFAAASFSGTFTP